VETLDLTLRSSIPGRQRWETTALYRRPSLARQVQAALSQVEGVRQVEANAYTGRILVLYDRQRFEDGVEPLIRRILEDRLGRGSALPVDAGSAAAPVPADDGADQRDENAIYRVLSAASPQPGQLGKAAIWTAASVVVGFLPTWGLSSLMSIGRQGSGAAEKAEGTSLPVLGLLTAASNAAEWYIKHYQRQLWKELASDVEHELRTRAFMHVEALDMSFFDRQSVGYVQSVLTSDISAVGSFLERGPSNAIQAFTSASLSLLSVALVSPSIALVLAAPAGGVVLLSRYFQRQIAPLYMEFAADTADMNKRLANSLGGIATVKSFTAEQDEADRIWEISDKRRLSYSRAVAASSKNASFAHGTVYSTVAAAAVTLGAMKVASGSMSSKSFQTVAQMIPKFFGAISQIDDIYDSYVSANMAAQRVMTLLDEVPAIQDGDSMLSLYDMEGDIAFEDVAFGYQEGFDILRGVSLSVGQGETVGIVGATGAGKTTIAKLLLRFYDVDGGTVTIDGTDVRDFGVRDLREAVSFVAQDVYLFDGTVFDNIAFGQPGATLEEVVEAAKSAEAHDFIMKLPDGYHSEVGERGQRLSMGQRQRISIARAMLKAAPIIILDEATASVDNETEAAIHRSIDKVAKGRSMIVIAHRLSTVRNSTRIYVLEDGHIIEHGTHDQLLEQGGLYASLWNVQTGNRDTEAGSEADADGGDDQGDDDAPGDGEPEPA